jgi:hypothetical protein
MWSKFRGEIFLNMYPLHITPYPRFVLYRYLDVELRNCEILWFFFMIPRSNPRLFLWLRVKINDASSQLAPFCWILLSFTSEIILNTFFLTLSQLLIENRVKICSKHNHMPEKVMVDLNILWISSAVPKTKN